MESDEGVTVTATNDEWVEIETLLIVYKYKTFYLPFFQPHYIVGMLFE